MSSLLDLNEALQDAPDFEIEVLTAAELDLVAGGPDLYLDGCISGTCSQCSTDGSDEGGTN